LMIAAASGTPDMVIAQRQSSPRPTSSHSRARCLTNNASGATARQKIRPHPSEPARTRMAARTVAPYDRRQRHPGWLRNRQALRHMRCPNTSTVRRPAGSAKKKKASYFFKLFFFLTLFKKAKQA
jgi:hypothetical protein